MNLNNTITEFISNPEIGVGGILTHLIETIQNNREFVLSKSLCNCHIKNVDSLVFSSEEDESLIRMFIAHEDHEMYEGWQVAIHDHHRDLTLIRLWGNPHHYTLPKTIANLESYKFSSGFEWFLKSYKFSSAINGVGVFEKYNSEELPSIYDSVLDLMAVTPIIKLDGSDLHTMTIPKGQNSGWLVVEGKRNKNYTGVCYSIQDLTTWTPEGLYQEMTDEKLNQLQEILNQYNGKVSNRTREIW